MPFPPILFIHGAANGAWVWDVWRKHLTPLGWDASVLDLRGHGLSLPVDFSEVTMEDYVADVESVTHQVAERTGAHPVILGWSMGGLVAMMYAVGHPETPALVLFSPSPPQQVVGRGTPEEIRKTPNTPFGPEIYGVYPDDFDRSHEALSDLTDDEARAVLEKSRGAQESGFARRQRKRGISIAQGSIFCPTLVVYGERDTIFPPETDRRVALFLAADHFGVPDAGHWGVVYSEKGVSYAAPRLDAWLRDALD